MFAFWRLYYDRRLSPYHTLAETFEGTNQSGLINPYLGLDETENFIKQAPSATTIGFKASPSLINEDAFNYLGGSIRLGGIFKGGRSWMINPVFLIRSLRDIFYSDINGQVPDHESSFQQLSITIDKLRSELAAEGFFIPRFSYEFSEKNRI